MDAQIVTFIEHSGLFQDNFLISESSSQHSQSPLKCRLTHLNQTIKLKLEQIERKKYFYE